MLVLGTGTNEPAGLTETLQAPNTFNNQFAQAGTLLYNPWKVSISSFRDKAIGLYHFLSDKTPKNIPVVGPKPRASMRGAVMANLWLLR